MPQKTKARISPRPRQGTFPRAGGFGLPTRIFIPGTGCEDYIHRWGNPSIFDELVPLGLSAFIRGNGLAKEPLVRFGKEWILGNDFEWKSLPNHRLAQKKSNGARQIKSCTGEEFFRLVAEIGINANL